VIGYFKEAVSKNR